LEYPEIRDDRDYVLVATFDTGQTRFFDQIIIEGRPRATRAALSLTSAAGPRRSPTIRFRMAMNLLNLEPVPTLLKRVARRAVGDFPAGKRIRVSRAPGRLDVMGGIADYTGSLVCEMRSIAPPPSH
jgi:hypothetical protein